MELIIEEETRTEKQRMYETQRWSFEKIIKRYAHHLIKEWKDLFTTFWIDYENKKVTSINDFLFKDRLDPKKILKRGFRDGR